MIGQGVDDVVDRRYHTVAKGLDIPKDMRSLPPVTP